MEVTELIGKTLVKVENKDNEELVFTASNGDEYKLYHMQDCCESVTIDDVVGDLQDLVGSEILKAEERVNEGRPEGIEPNNYNFADDSETWTFYHFATMKGRIDIRWFGTSNGYYSESVDFCKCNVE